METMTQSDLWSRLGTHSSVVVIWWLWISSSGETRKFDFLNQIWPWRSRWNVTLNNRDLNQAIFHLWSKFGDPSLNGSWVITQTSMWLTHRLTHTHGHTHTQTQAMTIPEGQNWPRVTRLILGLCQANERQHYFVTSSLIGWVPA